MLHRVASAILSDRTFDVSPMASLANDSKDAATIVAEASAAAAAQALKEFHRMHEPIIMKLKGGYSADAELMFHPWRSDILAHITDRELDSKTANQLIKEHLSITFQEGNNEANILAEFYSRKQYYKELEEAFADELQLLARKVISPISRLI